MECRKDLPVSCILVRLTSTIPNKEDQMQSTLIFSLLATHALRICCWSFGQWAMYFPLYICYPRGSGVSGCPVLIRPIRSGKALAHEAKTGEPSQKGHDELEPFFETFLLVVSFEYVCIIEYFLQLYTNAGANVEAFQALINKNLTIFIHFHGKPGKQIWLNKLDIIGLFDHVWPIPRLGLVLMTHWEKGFGKPAEDMIICCKKS